MESAVHQTRMQDIVSRLVCHSTRQPKVCQYLVAPLINGGYRLKRRSIGNSHSGARCINIVRLDLPPLHHALELLDIELGRSRLTAPDSAPLAMDDFLFTLLVVDFVFNLVVIIC